VPARAASRGPARSPRRRAGRRAPERVGSHAPERYRRPDRVPPASKRVDGTLVFRDRGRCEGPSAQRPAHVPSSGRRGPRHHGGAPVPAAAGSRASNNYRQTTAHRRHARPATFPLKLHRCNSAFAVPAPARHHVQIAEWITRNTSVRGDHVDNVKPSMST
jgi:hypothetical protein